MANSPYNVTLTWTTPTRPNGVVTHYSIYLDYNNGSTATIYPGGADREYVLDNLSPFQTITARLSAHTVIGEGPSSVARQAVTFETRKPFFCEIIMFARFNGEVEGTIVMIAKYYETSAKGHIKNLLMLSIAMNYSREIRV